MSSTHSTSIVVVGAGAFGVTAAPELRRRGHDVTLLEAGTVPNPIASSTDVSKVVRMDYGNDDFYSDLAKVSIERWRELNDRWDDRVYHETGILMLSGAPLDHGGFEADSLRVVRQRGAPAECIDGAEVGARFPAWSDGGLAQGDPLTVTADEQGACVEFVRHTFKGLRDAEVAGTRLCLYCDTWDGDFLIDQDPDRPGLVVAAGGSGHGFKFAPVLGDIIADVAERRPNPSAARFVWRTRGKRRTEPTRQRTTD